MNTLFEAEIFFIITSAVAIVSGVILIALLFYALRFIKNMKDISERIKISVRAGADDLDQFRENLKEKGLSWRELRNIFRAKKKRSRRK